jgi:hypothetical protein
MIMQKIFGARFILPKHMQPRIFDYYKDFDELDITHSNAETVLKALLIIANMLYMFIPYHPSDES